MTGEELGEMIEEGKLIRGATEPKESGSMINMTTIVIPGVEGISTQREIARGNRIGLLDKQVEDNTPTPTIKGKQKLVLKKCNLICNLP